MASSETESLELRALLEGRYPDEQKRIRTAYWMGVRDAIRLLTKEEPPQTVQ